FTSTTDLATRWDGEVYVEVHHKHAVPVEKQQQLQELGIPVVEIKLPEFFNYRREHDSTPELEEEHVAWICRTLQEGGFLAGEIISDRRSKEFLEAKVRELEQTLTAADASRKTMEDDYKKRLAQAGEEVSQLGKDVVDQQSGASRIATKVASLEGELADARKRLTAANDSVAAAKSEADKAGNLAKVTGVELATLRK
ncbi:hypothetical protein, partial [Paraburkholderia ribeironis]|uniref:hypothetical protein n=1 Tax=Paraburkholderia ribeironis TaxID=1247936 RepID=UPI001C3F61F3